MRDFQHFLFDYFQKIKLIMLPKTILSNTMLTENVENNAFYYRLLSILSEKSATITITIAIGGKGTFGHPCWPPDVTVTFGPNKPKM